jgi:hypothetical protein
MAKIVSRDLHRQTDSQTGQVFEQGQVAAIADLDHHYGYG